MAQPIQKRVSIAPSLRPSIIATSYLVPLPRRHLHLVLPTHGCALLTTLTALGHLLGGQYRQSPSRAPSHRSSASRGSTTSRDTIRQNPTMSGMMNTDRGRNRRERTFVGSECAVCEEPLEHTLRGERILQFSCSHVSHEACFYEFIKEFDSQYCPSCNAPLHLDTSRGGNVLDIGK